jgi:hypothetical protein
MSIQGNVNQIISLTALLATQTPGYKAAAEKRVEMNKIKQEEKVLGQREAVAQEKGGSTYNIKQERADLAYRKYKTSPSVKTADAVIEAEAIAEEERLKQPSDLPGFANKREEEAWIADKEKHEQEMLEEREMTPSEIAAQKAEMSAWEVQEAKRATNQRKMGYVSPTVSQVGHNEERLKTAIQQEQKEEKKNYQRGGNM